MSYRRRAAQSAEAFDRLVSPELLRLVPGLQEVLQVEGDPGALADALDGVAGIDYVLRTSRVEGGSKLTQLRGMSARVQPTDKPWQTFTVRMTSVDRRHPCEYHKRLEALRDAEACVIAPSWMLQAYVSKDRSKLLTMGLASTAKVIYAVRDAAARINPARRRAWDKARSGATLRDPGSSVYFRHNRQDGKVFAVVPWDAVETDVVDNRPKPTPKPKRASGVQLSLLAGMFNG